MFKRAIEDIHLLLYSSLVILTLSVLLFLSLLNGNITSITYAASLWSGIVLSCIGSSMFVVALKRLQKKHWFYTMIVLGIIIRLIVAIQPKGTLDLIGWEITGRLVLEGKDFYETGSVSFTPIWPWITGGMTFLSDLLNIPFYFMIRMPILLSDILLVFILRSISSKYSGSGNDQILPGTLLYFLNPLTLLATVYHPQFGVITFLFLLFGFRIMERNKNDLTLGSSVVFALATSIKHFTVPVLIALFFYTKNNLWRILLPVIVALTFILLVMPYYFKFSLTADSLVFSYMGMSMFGLWSMLFDSHPTLVIALFQYKRLFVIITFLICSIVVLFAKKRGKSVVEATQLSFLTFMLLTPGWGIQYLLWLLPFGILINKTNTQIILFSSFATLYYSKFLYGNWPINPEIFMPPLYFIMIWLFFKIYTNK